MKWILRILLVVVILVIVGGVILYFSLNGIVKSQIKSQGTAATGVETSVDSVNLSPFSGALALDQFALANPEGFGEGKVFKFNDADVKVSLGSLLSDEIVVNRVHIDGAEVLVMLDGTSLNIKTLYDQIQKRTSTDTTTTDEPPAEGGTQGFVVQDLKLTNTRMRGELVLPGMTEPLKIDLPLADINEKEVRGAEMGDVLAFVVETVMLNASRSLADFSPDLDQFLGGLEDKANAVLDDVSEQADEAMQGVTDTAEKVLPGSGDRLKEEKDKLLDQGKEGLGNLLGGKKKEKDPAE